ncbi:MAG: DNA-binding protein [Candidatus Omnitrophica bacterium CG07_land_8_20_14_0_80_50_8]|nr:MAG: DNA-binding protein [Candidatus Omnitrophica bacterium CG07_land_8_20_14_0_80_50_8]
MAKKSYLSIDEVAQRFGVNVTTIYRLAQKGKLPGFKIGNQWRFSEDLLESWATDQVTVKWLTAEEAAPPKQ